MRSEDVAFAVSLTDTETWGYTAADFVRFMALNPDGALVAWEGTAPVGVAIVTLYGPIAWVGSIIVTPEARGGGVGHALVQHAFDHVEAQGGHTVWLNAYTHTESFYADLGFQAQGSTAHLEGRAPGQLSEDVRLVHAGDLPGVAEEDARYFGADRRRLLEALYYEFGESFFVWQGESGWGLSVGTPYPGGVEVAPCVADRPAVAQALLEHLFAHYPDAQFGLNVPDENRTVKRLLRKWGFEATFTTVRMVWGRGEGALDPSRIVSLGGLEKG